MHYIDFQPFVNTWYDELNDANEHQLNHIVYACLECITDEDYE